jgi:hypothetical protein
MIDQAVREIIPIWRITVTVDRQITTVWRTVAMIWEIETTFFVLLQKCGRCHSKQGDHQMVIVRRSPDDQSL